MGKPDRSLPMMDSIFSLLKFCIILKVLSCTHQKFLTWPSFVLISLSPVMSYCEPFPICTGGQDSNPFFSPAVPSRPY